MQVRRLAVSSVGMVAFRSAAQHANGADARGLMNARGSFAAFGGQRFLAMREIQRCRKCGQVFAQIDRSGPSIDVLGDTMRQSGDKVCRRCGGSVIWVDYGGSPLSDYKRMEEANRHLRLGCLWGVVALIGWLIIYFVLR